MKRSVILMGGKTYVISLPAEWIKKQGIAKGQQLEVAHELDKITITADASRAPKKSMSMEYSPGKLIKAYQLGYDELKVTGRIEEIESETGLLPGFEIVQSNNACCLVRSVSEVQKDEMPALLRRAFLLLSGYSPKEEAKKTAITRLVSMCKRCVCKNGYGSFSESLSVYNLLCDMEKALVLPCKPSKALQGIYAKFSNISYDELAELKCEAKNDTSELVLTNAMQEVVMARA